MAFKRYYTVNGKIRGESTVAGGYRPYGTDALGSVTATYNCKGVLENTYRNAPYGTQVQKTGTAPDPSFKWNGGSGYRATGPNYALYYVRNRVYDNLTAQWTTMDPLWPENQSYAYGNDNPSRFIDPSGLLSVSSTGLLVRLLALAGQGVDKDELAEYAYGHALKHPAHQCAAYIRRALEAAGADTSKHPLDAGNYGRLLVGNGARRIPVKDYKPEIGDIAVFGITSRRRHGHIEVYTQHGWVSDYRQRTFLPYQRNVPPYTIYRLP